MNPNPESALNEAAGKLLLEDYDAFMRRAALMAQIHAGAPVKNAIVRNESPNGKESRVQLSRKTLPMESVDALLNPLAPHSLLNLSVKRKRRL